jgi:preprotein translocase subunit YajC
MLSMNTFIFPLLMGAPQTTGGAEGAQNTGGGMSMLITMGLVIAILYFLMIRPQNKKRKETEKMLSALKKGDKIVTIGGLHGTIQSVDETTVIIKADDNVKLKFLRSAVSTVSQVSADKEDKIEEKTEGDTSESGE